MTSLTRGKTSPNKPQQRPKIPILILHGWSKAMTGNRYIEVKKILQDSHYTVYTPDLPGFGNNTLTKDQLFFDDYVHFVNDFVAKLPQKKVILIGHSFGGRIAIRFSSLYPTKVVSLILTGASGIPRPLPSLKKKVVFIITKIVGPVFLIPPFSLFYKFFRKLIYYAIGEMDYYKAGSLTQTFKNVYKVSIVDDLEKIVAPTLLLWGENDTIIPLADAQFMNQHIANSKLVVIPETTHKLPYESPKLFAEKVLEFIERQK